jgi:hypothetical protein
MTYTKKQMTFMLNNYSNQEFNAEDLEKFIKTHDNLPKFPTPIKPKTITDVNKPKRAKNAFMFFTAEMRSKFASENPHLQPKEIAKFLGKMWNSMTDSDKQKYIDMNIKDKKRYDDEMKKYTPPNTDTDAHSDVDSKKSKSKVSPFQKPFDNFIMDNYKNDVNDFINTLSEKPTKKHDKVIKYISSLSTNEKNVIIDNFNNDQGYDENDLNDFKSFFDDNYP